MLRRDHHAERARLMRLSHWSPDPLTQAYSVNPLHEGRRDKPVGLWVSVDGEDDWEAWCQAEDWGDLPSKIRHEVVLAAEANLLHLTTAADLADFTDEYGTERHGLVWDIDWATIAARWQGIIIAPYQWSMRLDLRAIWYYGWDCASGCIWDAAAVAEVRLWQPAESEAVT